MSANLILEQEVVSKELGETILGCSNNEVGRNFREGELFNVVECESFDTMHTSGVPEFTRGDDAIGTIDL